MQQIEIYLEKFKDFGLKDKLFKKDIIEIIKEETGVELEEEDLNIQQSGIIRINVSGASKSEIFINKKKIQDRMERILEVL